MLQTLGEQVDLARQKKILDESGATPFELALNRERISHLPITTDDLLIDRVANKI